MADEGQEMSREEYLRSQFFTSDAEFAAVRADTPAKVVKLKRRVDAEMQALRTLVKTLESMELYARSCALEYLVDRYISHGAARQLRNWQR